MRGRLQDAGDAFDGVLGEFVVHGFVLPDADDAPSELLEAGGVGLVAFDVALKLGAPVLGVGARHGGVLGAAVPEASVDEDGDAPGREDDVDFDAAGAGVGGGIVGGGGESDVAVFAEAESAAVESAAEGDLGLGVGALVGLHGTAGGVG